MATGKCPECGSAFGKTAKFCKECGATLSEDAVPKSDTPVETLTEEAIAALDSTEADETPASSSESEPTTVSDDSPTSSPPSVPEVENGSYSLEIVGGLSAGERLSIPDDGAVLVGADKTANLCVRGDELMSRRHAAFTMRDGKLFVSDEDSTNGTFIRVGMARELAPGDTLTLGNTLLQVRNNYGDSHG